MITGRIFVQFARKKERQTGREVRKKRRELRDGARPIRQPKTTHTRHRNERPTVLLAASNKRRHSCPGHQCFEKFISHQLGLRRPTLPTLRHLLTKLRQHQRTPLAIMGFLDFSSPHTPAFTPGSHHPAAATPAEWQPTPATRVTLLLLGG